VTELPDHLDRSAHVDLHGRNLEPWFRRGGLVLLLAACVLGLANVFGLDGNPVVLVEDGKPIDDNLRRERISVEEIAAQARIQQIDSLRKIRWAILETSGEISFIPKSGS
jgi:hypothetical protein